MECNNISAQAVEYDYFSDEHPLYQAIADSDPVRAKTTLDHMRKENIDLENLETDDYVEAPVTEALLQGLTAKTPSLEQQKVVALLLSYGASPYHNAGSVYRAPTWSRHPTLTRI